MRGRLAEPALDGEDDGRPADHLVAGEDLREVHVLVNSTQKKLVGSGGWAARRTRTAAMGRVDEMVPWKSLFSLS